MTEAIALAAVLASVLLALTVAMLVRRDPLATLLDVGRQLVEARQQAADYARDVEARTKEVKDRDDTIHRMEAAMSVLRKERDHFRAHAVAGLSDGELRDLGNGLHPDGDGPRAVPGGDAGTRAAAVPDAPAAGAIGGDLR